MVELEFSGMTYRIWLLAAAIVVFRWLAPAGEPLHRKCPNARPKRRVHKAADESFRSSQREVGHRASRENGYDDVSAESDAENEKFPFVWLAGVVAGGAVQNCEQSAVRLAHLPRRNRHEDGRSCIETNGEEHAGHEFPEAACVVCDRSQCQS